MRSWTRLLICLWAVTALACTGGAGPSAVRTDSAGVEIVQSPGEDRPLSWTLEPKVTIASDDTQGAGVFDPNEYAIRTDSVGRVYVMDRSGNRIIVFDVDGRYLRSLGRKGGGPGELGFPLAFAVAANGTVSVFDAAKHRLVRFAPDGSILPEKEMGSGFFGGSMYASGDDYLYSYQGRGPSGTTSGVYHVTSTGGSVLVESADPPMKPIELKSCGMSFSGMPPLLAPSYRWDANRGQLAITRDAEYDIGIYKQGKLKRRIRREIPPRAATRELAMQELGDGMRVGTEGGVRVCQPDEVVEQRGYAPTIPAIGRIAIAPDGAIWLRRGGVKGEDLPIDVFTSDGAYEGSLPPETPFPAAFLSPNRIATVVKDEMDVGRIVIYQINR